MRRTTALVVLAALLAFAVPSARVGAQVPRVLVVQAVAEPPT